MYLFLPTDLTSLDPPNLLDFRSAVKTFDKLERLRRDEEAKVCHLLISSFSEEAKMLLRSVHAFVTAFNDYDSFAMHRIAKESHTCKQLRHRAEHLPPTPLRHDRHRQHAPR